MKPEDRAVLVTGANRGIGRGGAAKALERQNAALVDAERVWLGNRRD